MLEALIVFVGRLFFLPPVWGTAAFRAFHTLICTLPHLPPPPNTHSHLFFSTNRKNQTALDFQPNFTGLPVTTARHCWAPLSPG
jgi:hypothetical protein